MLFLFLISLVSISLVSISFVIAVYQMLELLKNGTQYYAVWTTDTFFDMVH